MTRRRAGAHSGPLRRPDTALRLAQAAAQAWPAGLDAARSLADSSRLSARCAISAHGHISRMSAPGNARMLTRHYARCRAIHVTAPTNARTARDD